MNLQALDRSLAPVILSSGYCSACNGSGEGMYDGARCAVCRGHGEVDDDLADDDNYEEPIEDDLPLTWKTGLAAVLIAALSIGASALAPMGFAR